MINGHDRARNRAQAHASLGYLPEAATGFDDLTVGEFLTSCAQARGLQGADRSGAVRTVSEETAFGPALDQVMRWLSKGWRQRVWVAQAVMHRPRALILDEQTDALDPCQKEHLRALIRSLLAHTAVLLTTHILVEAEALWDRVLVIVQAGLSRMSRSAQASEAPAPDARGGGRPRAPP